MFMKDDIVKCTIFCIHLMKHSEEITRERDAKGVSDTEIIGQSILLYSPSSEKLNNTNRRLAECELKMSKRHEQIHHDECHEHVCKKHIPDINPLRSSVKYGRMTLRTAQVVVSLHYNDYSEICPLSRELFRNRFAIVSNEFDSFVQIKMCMKYSPQNKINDMRLFKENSIYHSFAMNPASPYKKQFTINIDRLKSSGIINYCRCKCTGLRDADCKSQRVESEKRAFFSEEMTASGIYEVMIHSAPNISEELSDGTETEMDSSIALRKTNAVIPQNVETQIPFLKIL
ncbi:hypothetical protein WA026_015454 [Henosepilachna vigintioctopunctata]|uniref:Uncharacterized protein n=1 Tax=Henosepilachna vigintioctopunctata TaxID=420089 RepID=A0AAW1ULF6_9CUCU